MAAPVRHRDNDDNASTSDRPCEALPVPTQTPPPRSTRAGVPPVVRGLPGGVVPVGGHVLRELPGVPLAVRLPLLQLLRPTPRTLRAMPGRLQHR
jgi:hypothetical protein